MRVRINEPGSQVTITPIDTFNRSPTCKIPDLCHLVPANSYIRFEQWLCGSVDYPNIANENVE
jgi:hypothetical protein